MHSTSSEERAARAVTQTRQIGHWLTTVGGVHSDFAVDMADLLAAVRLVEEEVSNLVQLDVGDPAQADEALKTAGRISAQLFTELRDHLDGLDRQWAVFEDRLERLGTPDVS